MKVSEKNKYFRLMVFFSMLVVIGIAISKSIASNIAEIEKKLMQDNVLVKKQAIRQLSKFDDISAIPLLEKATKDAEADVRTLAIQSIKNVCINIFLRNAELMINDHDEDVKSGIIRALSDLDPMITTNLLEKLARDSNPVIRTRTIEVMGQTKYSPFLPIILEALKDPHVDLRISAVYALVEFQEKSAAKDIAMLAFDKNASVKEAAIDALGILRNKEALPTLAKLLDDKDEKMRFNVATAIRRIKDSEAIPILSKMLSDPSPMIKMTALNGLADIKDASSIPIIGKFVTDKDKDIRGNAIKSLKAFGSSDAIPYLLQAAKDQEAMNRAAAILAIAEIVKEGEVNNEISSLINASFRDSDKVVRQSAASAVAKMQDHTHFKMLISLLKDPESNVRHSAIMALGELHEKRAIPHLIDSFEDEEVLNKVSIINALEKIGDRAALPLFKKAARFEDVMIKKTGISALGNMMDAEAEAILLEALHDPIDEIRIQAKKSLQKSKQKEEKEK